MPELPEVETARRGIAPHLEQRKIQKVIVRQSKLRWEIPKNLARLADQQTITSVGRRGKYLIITLETGSLLLHLGMSGVVRIVPSASAVGKHDHVDIQLEDGLCCRFTDPRRFGALLWTAEDPLEHHLLAKLGPEPLTRAFNARMLHDYCQRRTANIKSVIMDSHCVVGVGNIYAAESLFLAGILPTTPANMCDYEQCESLVAAIKSVLKKAIAKGGTTLRDFLNSDGKPGYFRHALQVYGRENQPCLQCDHPLQHIRLNQRATVFCPQCQQ